MAATHILYVSLTFFEFPAWAVCGNDRDILEDHFQSSLPCSVSVLCLRSGFGSTQEDVS